jgi:hypothetical protein
MPEPDNRRLKREVYVLWKAFEKIAQLKGSNHKEILEIYEEAKKDAENIHLKIES